MSRNEAEPRFVVCVRNEDCEDLEPRKIYRVLPDVDAGRDGYVRVVDESGEDYLYPADYFLSIELSRDVEEALMSAA
jgi:signal transduction histidine kinase